MTKILLISDAGKGKDGWYHVGDEAVFWSLYQRIKRANTDLQITIFARSVLNKKITDVSVINSEPFFNKKINFILLNIFPLFNVRFFRPVMFLFFPQYKRLFDEIKSVDYIAVSGGGNLNSHFSEFIFNRFIIVLFAKILYKKIYFAPQTIGPLFYKKDRYFIKYIAKRANFLQVRDDSSFEMIKMYNTVGKIVKTLDDAFRMKYIKNVSLVKKAKFNIAISLRDWDTENTILAIGNFIKVIKMLYTDIHFYIVPHIFDDNNLGDIGITKILLEKHNVPFTTCDANFFKNNSNHRPEEVIASIIEDMNLVITTRYHGAVFGLRACVKVICFYSDSYYEKKFRGLREILGYYICKYFLYMVDVRKQMSDEVMFKFLNESNSEKVHDFKNKIDELARSDDIVNVLRKG